MERPTSDAHPLVILNPTANGGDMRRYRTLIRSRLAECEAGYVETSKPGDAQDRALYAAREGRPVIVVGGDGTVNEVVNGILLAGKPVPLGIVPAGSGNDFALSTLKLSSDPTAAIERAFTGSPVGVDAGIINGRYFANSFSVGLDANIGATANWMKKIPFMSNKRLYYAATLHQLLFAYRRCPVLKFRLDNNQHEQDEKRRYVLLAVTNGPTYGAGFRINPDADPADGFLDVCAIYYAPLLRALKLLPVVQQGRHAGLPEVTFYRAKKVHIESSEAVTMQADGEIRQATSFQVEILPKALLVRV